MPIEWNPNAEPIIGVEHPAVGYANLKSDNYQDQWALTFEARDTQPLERLRLFFPFGSQTSGNGYQFSYLNSPFIVELYPEGAEVTGAPIHDIFTPSNLGTFSGGFSLLSYSAGVPALADIQNLNDGLGFKAYLHRAFFDVQFATQAFPLNRKILRMGLESYVTGPWFVQRADNGTVTWDAIVIAFQPTTSPGTHFYHGEAIVTGGPSPRWQIMTPQFIRDFRSTGLGGPHFYRIAEQAGAGTWSFDHVRMHVVSLPETRIGVGVATYDPGLGSSTLGRWIVIPMTTPAGTGTPSLVSGNRYTLVVRRNTGDSHYTSTQFCQTPARYLRGFPQDPDDYILRPVIQKVPDAAVPGANNADFWLNGTLEPTGLGDQVEGVLGLRLNQTAAIYLNASQPYEFSMPGAMWGGKKDIIPATNAPTTGCEIVQSLVAGGSGMIYGQVGLIVGLRDFDPQPNGPITVNVYDDPAMSSLVLGPAELTLDQWNTAPFNVPFNDTDLFGCRYKHVRVRFPQSVNLPADTYFVRLRAPACDESHQWKVAVLHTFDKTANNIEAVGSFGGTTEFATGFINRGQPGSAAYTLMASSTRFTDAQITLMTVPVAPTGVGAEVYTVNAHHVHGESCSDPTDSLCGEETIQGIQVSWDNISDPMVTSYQIQRKDETEEAWTFVAEIGAIVSGAPIPSYWEDYECRMAVPNCYRVRAARSDGITGDWSAEVCATITDTRVALSFTSNSATGMGCVYPEMWEGAEPEQSWEFNEYSDVERHLIYGKDGQAAFHPTERRGDSFTRVILLNAVASVGKPSLDITDPLRDLSWAALPYICVRDGKGNRWFASIELPSAVHRKRINLWFAEVTVVEAITEPALVDNRVQQVTSS